MSEEKGLIELKPLNIPELFEKGEGVELIINKVKEEVSKHVPDVSSEQGRKDIRKLATMVNKTSSAIDDMGKQLISEQNEIIKRVNGNRKEIRDELEKVRASARKPLLDWEAAEFERKEKIQEKIDAFKVEVTDAEGNDYKSAYLLSELKRIREMEVDSSFGEFMLNGQRQKEETIALLTSQIDKVTEREKEQEELAKLRQAEKEREWKEREEKIKREAAEEARKKAEEKADLEKAELKKKADAAIEAQRKSEEAAAKEKAEAERIARIERDNLAKREADKEHRAKINNAAMKALQDNIPQLSSDDAKEIVIAIARNLISNVKISY